MTESIVNPIEQGANLDPDNNMASLLEAEGVNIDFPRQGEIRQGILASISKDQILVSVGTKSEGVIINVFNLARNPLALAPVLIAPMP